VEHTVRTACQLVKAPEKAIYFNGNIELEGIKMASGQPQGPGQYPMYQPAYQPPRRTTEELMTSMVSDTFLAFAFVVGLLLMLVGSWLLGLMDTNGGRNAGQVVKSLGVVILVAGGLLGGLLRKDMDHWVRAALVIFATVVLVAVGFWYLLL
jgi:hypothetical protein